MSESPDINIPQKNPYVIETQPGKYAWCSCGKSAKQPFCDGSHKGTNLAPVIVDVNETKNVAWCGCKYTNNKPFCDGSHNKAWCGCGHSNNKPFCDGSHNTHK